MSKPDPTGGSLEQILASIRRSLSEQSTDALVEDEDAARADAGKDANTPPRKGLTQRLAGATVDRPETHNTDIVEPHENDLADLLEDRPPLSVPQSPPVTSSPAATTDGPAQAQVPAPARSDSDPLWFLSRQAQSAATKSEQPSMAGAPQATSIGGKTPVAEPKLSRPEVLRASLPPFFGSSAEAAKAEVVLAEPVSRGVGVMQPPAAQPATTPRGAEREPAKAALRSSEPAIARDTPAGAVAAEAAAGGSHQSSVAAGATMRNGKASTFFERAAVAEAKANSAGETPYTHALEAMVLELLQPMLRQWLDQNMPRLVSAALKDEAARVAAAGRDAKKS